MASAKPSTYTHKKKSPVKEKTLEEEALEKPLTKEKFPEEAEKAGSPAEESRLKKKKRIEEETDSEETESLENYIGERDDEDEEDQELLVFSMHDSEEE
ncbi:hypothetical protein KI387_011808, partial [Taxus chinensis]